MTTFIASPSGGTGAGSLADPWSVAKALGSTGAGPGDTVEFRGGIYAQTFNPQRSGTSDSARIIFKQYQNERPIFDGSRRAANLLTATPDPFNDSHVPREDSGWSAYTSPYADDDENPASPHPIWQKTAIGTVLGVFMDAFESGSGPAVAGKWASLWDMGRYNVRGSNPVPLHLHDFNSSHDIGENSLPMHHWEAQFQDLGGGTVIVRGYDAANPSTHKVYLTGKDTCCGIQGKAYLTIDGLWFWRWRRPLDFDACSNIIVQNCNIQYASTTAVWAKSGSNNFKFLNNTVKGGGSASGHYEDGVRLDTGCNNCVIQGNDISWGGHSGILMVPGIGSPLVRGNYVHDCAGSHITMDDGITGAVCEYNIIARGNRSYEVNVHKVPHGGFQIGDSSNGIFRHNLIFEVGDGFLVTCGDPRGVFQNNRVYRNTVSECERHCAHLRNDTTRTGVDSGNNWVNNIFATWGQTVQTDFSGYGLYLEIRDAGTDIWSSDWANNHFFKSGNTNAIRIARINSGTVQTSPPVVNTVAAAQSNYPAAFTGNNQANDPLFVNAATDDYTLQSTSTCIDTGVATYAGQSTTDVPTVGTAPDRGYWERTSGTETNNPPVVTITNFTPASGNAPLTVSLAASATDPDTTHAHGADTIGAWEVNWGDGSALATGSGGTINPSAHSYLVAGSYTVSVRAQDSPHGMWSAPVTRTAQVAPAGGTGVSGVTPLAAWASSSEGAPNPHPPQNTIDGQTIAQNAESYWAASPMPQWCAWDVTLAPGALKQWSGANISFKNYALGRVYTFDFQLSDKDAPTEADWVTVVSNQLSAGTEYTAIAFAPRASRHGRAVLKSASDATTWASIAEVTALIADIPPGQQGTKWTPVTVTDIAAVTGLYNATKLTDGKLSKHGDPLARWKAGPPPQPVWIDYGQNRTIGRLEIGFWEAESGKTYTYTVATSQTATATYASIVWTDQVSGTSTPADPNVIVLPAAVSARHLRVTVNTVSEGTEVSLTEIAAYSS